MQFVQVKEARSPQTSQSGSAFGGGRAVADATAAEAAAEGGVGWGVEPWRSSSAAGLLEGDGPVAVVGFFPSLFFDMLIVCGSDERVG